MRRPTLIVNKSRVAALLHGIGGISGLADRWGKRFGDLPDRTTLYDWTNGKRLPRSIEDILRLCACLEMDPMAALAAEGASVASVLDWLLRQSLAGLKTRGIPAAGIVDLFGPRPDWPAPGLVRAIYGSGWRHKDFLNAGQDAPFYQRARIVTTAGGAPQTLHFAYRGETTELWRTYGHVTIERGQAELVHYFGPNATGSCAEDGSISVETHFGAGRCHFRIASLKPFEIDLVPNDTRDRSANSDAVRFTA